MSVKGPINDLDALSANRNAALPFLPTLVTAIAVGGFAFLCRQPTVPEAPPVPLPAIVAASASDVTGKSAGEAPTLAAAIPGAVAFGQQYPWSPVAPANASRPSTSRIASTARRGCGSGRCADARRAEPVRSAANPPRIPEPATTLAFPRTADDAQRDDSLPEGALPFIPTAASLVESVRSLGSQAVTLGGSVAGSLADLR